ncbi:MAG: miniconductance mechanosensitive channel [Firmicutes bacterium]|nr:miniconductance mechanosensitive channel [Bacillota bacterium]
MRQLTNLGTFRAYMVAYLKAHSGIHHGMITMVRQLAPDDKGIPLEVYAFTNTTEWEPYENIQSDIFDHFFSAAQAFGLEIYQSPSGSDLRGWSLPEQQTE